MGLCPYTFVTGLLKSNKKKSTSVEASELRVVVTRDSVEKVNVTLPARSARWLIELIPQDIVEKIYEEKIPLDEIQDELAKSAKLYPCEVFHLSEPNRSVKVWLE